MSEDIDEACQEEFDSSKDIFLGSYWFGPTTSCRSWHFHGDDLHKLSFRHGQLNGKWLVIVDGIIQKIGYVNPINCRYFEVPFSIDSKSARVICDGRNAIKYKYDLAVDGREIIDMRLATKILLRFGENLPLSVCIPDCRTYTPEENEGTKEITVFQLFVQLRDSQSVFVERRYSEFVMLDQIISRLTDSSMRSSLPVLPSKLLFQFSKSKNDQLEYRRSRLEAYIQKVIRDPTDYIR